MDMMTQFSLDPDSFGHIPKDKLVEVFRDWLETAEFGDSYSFLAVEFDTDAEGRHHVRFKERVA